MLIAAIPVEAVIATLLGEKGSFRSLIISRRRTDLPVPIRPQYELWAAGNMTPSRTSGTSEEDIFPLLYSCENLVLLWG